MKTISADRLALAMDEARIRVCGIFWQPLPTRNNGSLSCGEEMALDHEAALYDIPREDQWIVGR